MAPAGLAKVDWRARFSMDSPQPAWLDTRVEAGWAESGRALSPRIGRGYELAGVYSETEMG